MSTWWQRIRAKSYVKRGDEATRARKFSEAVAHYSKAIELAPEIAAEYESKLAAAHNNHGFILGQQDDQNGAIRHYTEALRLKPDFAVAYMNRGVAYGKKGIRSGNQSDYERCVADCSHAIVLEPDYGEAYGNRAFAHAKLEDIEHAIADYSEVIRIAPDLPYGYHGRSELYRKTGQLAEAEADAKRLATILDATSQATARPLHGAENAVPWPYPVPEGASTLTFSGAGDATTGEFTLEEDAVLRIIAQGQSARLGVKRGDGTFLIKMSPIPSNMPTLMQIPEGGTYRIVVECQGNWGATVVFRSSEGQ